MHWWEVIGSQQVDVMYTDVMYSAGQMWCTHFTATQPLAFSQMDSSIQPAHGIMRWAKVRLKNLTTRYTRKCHFHRRWCCWGNVGTLIFRSRLGREALWCLNKWHRIQGSRRPCYLTFPLGLLSLLFSILPWLTRWLDKSSIPWLYVYELRDLSFWIMLLTIKSTRLYQLRAGQTAWREQSGPPGSRDDSWSYDSVGLGDTRGNGWGHLQGTSFIHSGNG